MFKNILFWIKYYILCYLDTILFFIFSNIFILLIIKNQLNFNDTQHLKNIF